MELKTSVGLVLVLFLSSLFITQVTSRPEHRMGNGRHHSFSGHHTHHSHSNGLSRRDNYVSDNVRKSMSLYNSEDMISSSNNNNNNNSDEDNNEDSAEEDDQELLDGGDRGGGGGGGGGRGRFGDSTRNRGRTAFGNGGNRYSSRRRPAHTNTRIVDAGDDDYDYDGGRHAYLMTTDNNEKKAEEADEDQVINAAFERHMRPHQQSQQHHHHHHKNSNNNKRKGDTHHHHHSTGDSTSNNNKASTTMVQQPEQKQPEEQQPTASEPEQMPEHDVYAYQLPSNLWFMVRYVNDSQGHIQKYMNIVDSFTNYLDKLEKGVRTVSVNVKGVETVFRLTAKHKPYQPPPNEQQQQQQQQESYDSGASSSYLESS